MTKLIYQDKINRQSKTSACLQYVIWGGGSLVVI